jgi:hypothetical protein
VLQHAFRAEPDVLGQQVALLRGLQEFLVAGFADIDGARIGSGAQGEQAQPVWAGIDRPIGGLRPMLPVPDTMIWNWLTWWKWGTMTPLASISV